MFETKTWTGNLPSSRSKAERKGVGTEFLRIYSKKGNVILFIYLFLQYSKLKLKLFSLKSTIVGNLIQFTLVHTRKYFNKPKRR